jgi:hypothetical protein
VGANHRHERHSISGHHGVRSVSPQHATPRRHPPSAPPLARSHVSAAQKNQFACPQALLPRKLVALPCPECCTKTNLANQTNLVCPQFLLPHKLMAKPATHQLLSSSPPHLPHTHTNTHVVACTSVCCVNSENSENSTTADGVWHACVGVWVCGCGGAGAWRYGRTKASEASPNPARHTYLESDSLAQSLVSHLGEGNFFPFSRIFYLPISLTLTLSSRSSLSCARRSGQRGQE